MPKANWFVANVSAIEMATTIYNTVIDFKISRLIRSLRPPSKKPKTKDPAQAKTEEPAVTGTYNFQHTTNPDLSEFVPITFELDIDALNEAYIAHLEEAYEVLHQIPKGAFDAVWEATLFDPEDPEEKGFGFEQLVYLLLRTTVINYFAGYEDDLDIRELIGEKAVPDVDYFATGSTESDWTEEEKKEALDYVPNELFKVDKFKFNSYPKDIERSYLSEEVVTKVQGPTTDV
eukprot:Platyproteum_vivax@DN5982_c0_g1_i2.p1